MFDFGLLLKELRVKKGYSQEQVADKIHRSRTSISQYESNEKLPPLPVLIDLASLFHVSLDYLAGLEKKKYLLVDDLSERQINVIETLAEEFRDKPSLPRSGLSQRQQELLNILLVEFNDK